MRENTGLNRENVHTINSTNSVFTRSYNTPDDSLLTGAEQLENEGYKPEEIQEALLTDEEKNKYLAAREDRGARMANDIINQFIVPQTKTTKEIMEENTGLTKPKSYNENGEEILLPTQETSAFNELPVDPSVEFSQNPIWQELIDKYGNKEQKNNENNDDIDKKEDNISNTTPSQNQNNEEYDLVYKRWPKRIESLKDVINYFKNRKKNAFQSSRALYEATFAALDPDFKPDTNQRLASREDSEEFGYTYKPKKISGISQYYLKGMNNTKTPEVKIENGKGQKRPNDGSIITGGGNGGDGKGEDIVNNYEDNYFYFAHRGNGLEPFDVNNNEIKQADPRLINTPIDLERERPFGEYTNDRLQEFYAVYDNELKTRMIEHNGESIDPNDNLIERYNALNSEIKRRVKTKEVNIKPETRNSEVLKNGGPELDNKDFKIIKSESNLDENNIIQDIKSTDDKLTPMEQEQVDIIAQAFQKEPDSNKWQQKENVNLGSGIDRVYVDLGITPPEQAIGPDGKVYYNIEELRQALLDLKMQTKHQTFRALDDKNHVVKYKLSKRRIKKLQKYLKEGAVLYISEQQNYNKEENDVRERSIRGVDPTTGKTTRDIPTYVGNTNLGENNTVEHENMNSGAYVSRQDILNNVLPNVFVRKTPWALLAAPLVLTPFVPGGTETNTTGEIEETQVIDDEVRNVSDLAIGDQVVVPNGLTYYYTSKLDNPSGTVGRNVGNDTNCTVNSFAIYNSNGELIYANHLQDNNMLPYGTTYEDAIEQLKSSGKIQSGNEVTVRVHLQQGTNYSNDQDTYLGWITLDDFKDLKNDGRVQSVGQNISNTTQNATTNRDFTVTDTEIDNNGTIGITFADNGEEIRIPHDAIEQGTTFEIVDQATGEKTVGQVTKSETETNVKNIFGMTLKSTKQQTNAKPVYAADMSAREVADAAIQGIKR